MSYWFVVYLAGHLLTYAGPMHDPAICKMMMKGYLSVQSEDLAETHPACDLRTTEPQINELEQRS